MPGNRWIQFNGVVLTLLLVVLFSLLYKQGTAMSNAFLLLLLAVAYTAFWGGLLVGLLSACLSVLYDLYALSSPGNLFQYDASHSVRLLLLTLISVLLVLIIGGLRQRLEHSTQSERRTQGLARNLEVVAQSERQAREQVDALFETMTDSVMVFDQKGHVLRMNRAARERLSQFGLADNNLLSLQYIWQREQFFTESGEQLSYENDPLTRILKGEILSGANTPDLLCRMVDGQEIWVSIAGAPTYDYAGHISGALLVMRNVTERHQSIQHTQESLEALLQLAQEMVLLPGSKNELALVKQDVGIRTEQIAQRLIELIRRVLHCQRVGITIFDPETRVPRSLAVTGISAEQERLWKARAPGTSLYEIMADQLPEKRLKSGEVMILDYTQPPLYGRPNPFSIRQGLLAPMMLDSTLVGVLVLDYGSIDHTYTEQEKSLVRAVAQLSALVVERERLLTEWAKARANAMALRESNQLMDEFIGIAGHELRTPLTTMKASIQLAQRQLQKGQISPFGISDDMRTMIKMVSSLLQRTERQVNLQNRLVNDLLDITRIQSQHMELHIELCDLTTLVREVVEDQRSLNPQRTISETAPESGVHVFADADRLRQVINNYLSNALKYSSGDKPVQVCVRLQRGQVCVQVRDEGLGLSEEQQRHIWERFYRVSGIQVLSGASVGLGLGLHISKMIIERLGGQVGVESILGEGSTFWFTLPLANTREG